MTIFRGLAINNYRDDAIGYSLGFEQDLADQIGGP